MKWTIFLAFFSIPILTCAQITQTAPANVNSSYTLSETGEGEDDPLFLPDEFLPKDFIFNSSTILALKNVTANIEIDNSTNYLVNEFISEFENAKSYHLIDDNSVIMELVDGKKLQFPIHLLNNEQVELLYELKGDVNNNVTINISLTK